MNTLKALFVMVFLTFIYEHAKAQDHTITTPSIEQVLPLLTHEEKIKLLDLALQMHEQDLDQLIVNIYRGLPPGHKESLLDYANNLHIKDVRTTVQWNAHELDFGKKIEKEPIIARFYVTNTGTNPYLIKEIKTSCECLTVKYPKTPIKPQQSGLIEVQYDTNGFYGKSTQGIVVYDNSSPNLRNILYLKGHILPHDNNPGRQ